MQVQSAGNLHLPVDLDEMVGKGERCTSIAVHHERKLSVVSSLIAITAVRSVVSDHH
jgi:hypothetical protein